MDVEELRENIASMLRERLGAGVSQSDLARRSGLTQGAISGWLNKRSSTRKPSLPSLYSVVSLAETLDVSLDMLLRRREFWPELQDPRIRALLTALRGMDLDSRLPELCRDFLSLDEEGRKLSLAMMKTYIEHKTKGGSDAERPPETVAGAG